ncbi:hypothetical protein [Niallia taxi]|uniref:hypothetical protein n=1 Tax=Niallia taxi TaxID=2499688 RepID=UPI0015F616CE|nr:hypothetical protein [Niallia taxi]MED4057718.1 hypothetical protein [Niallia taxi]
MTNYVTIRNELEQKFNQLLIPYTQHLALIELGFNYSMDAYENRIEIDGHTNDDHLFHMFALTIHDADPQEPGQIQIDTLMMIEDIRKLKYRLVMKLIEITYQVATKYNYNTLIVGMVPGFYNNMVNKKGAIPLTYEDVQLVATTNLK